MKNASEQRLYLICLRERVLSALRCFMAGFKFASGAPRLRSMVPLVVGFTARAPESMGAGPVIGCAMDVKR